MSPLFSFLLVFCLFSIPSFCSPDGFEECDRKMDKLEHKFYNHNSISIDQYNMWKRGFSKQCLELKTCIDGLDKSDDTLLAKKQELEGDHYEFCVRGMVIDHKFQFCILAIKPDVVKMRNSNYNIDSDEECEFNRREMLMIGSVILKKCGVVEFQQFREHEMEFRRLPCNPTVKEMIGQHTTF